GRACAIRRGGRRSRRSASRCCGERPALIGYPVGSAKRRKARNGSADGMKDVRMTPQRHAAEELYIQSIGAAQERSAADRPVCQQGGAPMAGLSADEKTRTAS